MDDVITERHFETAEALWAHLMDPANYQERTRWVFRGHGDASWKLVPKAHRKGKMEEFLGGQGLLMEKERHEITLLKWFVLAADDAGLGVGEALRWVHQYGYGSGPWPPEAVENALALAQHYGLPTRLLDWTRSAATAAYFSATQAMELLEEKKAGDGACVWALETERVKHVAPPGYSPLRVATPAKATNPNLNAQGGLFSLLADAGAEPLALEDYVRLMGQNGLLEKLVFPASEAPRLAEIVSEVAAVTGRSVFPGYGGVVQSLKEEAMIRRLRNRRKA